MITTNDVSLIFGSRKLFDEVTLKFTPGNCYGVIGANGAGKSTFLKLLSGELEPNHGDINIPSSANMSVLKQDHFEFDDETVLQTVMLEIWSEMATVPAAATNDAHYFCIIIIWFSYAFTWFS